jgi:DNA-binding GntR family transcriptional regulator
MEMKPDSTADTVAASLRKLIAAGDLADGARLVERELASRLSVSKIHLREGLQKLKHEGLIEINKNRGAVVRTLTLADVEEIYSLRMLLEGDAIYHAVRRMDDATFTRVKLVHGLLGEATTPERQDELHREFHELLYAPCANARQLKSIRDLQSQVERYERFQTALLAGTRAFENEHENILKACQVGNARLAQSMIVAHLAAVKGIVTKLANTPAKER